MTMDDLRQITKLSAENISGAFDAAADQLLNHTDFCVFGRRCRLLEIEFYLYCAAHPDPFAHCHETQRRFGYWYFHRVGKGYRNGSFKGLDLTFGGEDSFGGVLIRSLADEQGTVVCGPSLCVDFLIAASGDQSVRALAERVGETSAVEGDSPLRLEVASEPNSETVYSSARVGLSMAGLPEGHDGERYLHRRYRYLLRPRAIKKGRSLLIQGMHRSGLSVDRIRALTGSPRKSIEKHIAAVEEAGSE